ncbi:DUF4214 domain-containing protein [Comamonas sp. HJ-2]
MSQTDLIDVALLEYLSDEAFVHHCFVKAFKSVCSPSRAKYYLLQLAGGMARADVARGIFLEDEYEHRVSATALRELPKLKGDLFIRKTYELVLGREADNSGIDHYSGRLVNGCGTLFVLKDILSSAEGSLRCANYPQLNEFRDFLNKEDNFYEDLTLSTVKYLTAAAEDEFIQKAYLIFLRREADAAGLENYQNARKNGLSRMRLLYSLAFSEEGRNFRKPLSIWIYLKFGRFFW